MNNVVEFPETAEAFVRLLDRECEEIETKVDEEMNKTRRSFLTGLGGATAGVVASVVALAAPRIEEEVIKKTTYEHELVKVEHFLTKGDGTQDGDLAMLMVDGHYKAHVLRNGKWRRQFAD